MKKVYVTWHDVQRQTQEILRQMQKESWKPDYIVGITRGGLTPSNLLSQYLDVTMFTLDVRLRDSNDGPESNCWMAEDAFGYEHHKILEHNADISASAGEPIVNLPISKKNILIVDDINDTGATFKWIREDWESGCLPGHQGWDTVWNQNVRFATMCEKTHTKFDGVDYCWKEIDTSEDDTWIVFPWEYDE